MSTIVVPKLVIVSQGKAPTLVDHGHVKKFPAAMIVVHGDDGTKSTHHVRRTESGFVDKAGNLIRERTEKEAEALAKIAISRAAAEELKVQA